MSKAYESAKRTAKGEKPTFEFAGETFTIDRKPNPLLMSELARTNSEDPESLGVLAEFFEHVLGPAEFRRFKKVFYAAPESDDEETIGDLLAAVIEAAFGRPTE